jgi:hypothetical protein
MSEQTIADAYMRVHTAMRGLYANLISAQEYLQIIREIRIELQEKQSEERKQSEEKKAG